MKLSAQIKLYILSLAILFLIVFLITVKLDICTKDIDCAKLTWKNYAVANWLPIVMLFAMGYCEIIRREFEHMLDGGAGDSLYVVECRSENYEHLTFLATYIIPFFGFSFTETGRLLAYGVLLIVIGAIFIKTDKYYANPTLALFGYKLYRVTMSDANARYESVIVITKSSLSANQPVNYKLLSNNVYYVRKVVQ
ncbi:anti-phage protein KwaA [Vibrio owensii]|uniref:anti-phage protein KwaA n=1 Tax=Vibrio owensii TaxID=696485 RepID=UPI003CE5B5F8